MTLAISRDTLNLISTFVSDISNTCNKGLRAFTLSHKMRQNENIQEREALQ